MHEDYKAVRATAQMLLKRRLDQQGGEPVTSDDIRSVVEKAIALFDCDGVSVDEVVAELEASFQTIIGQVRVLEGDREGYEPWLQARRGTVAWRFWDRYEQHLLQRGFPQATLDKLNESTDTVLGLLTAPDREGAWDRRGMVVGHVQSGKTSHYTGLICKAADAGYKLIIVLAGFHKSLRSQTQIRLEEGFLGYSRDAATPSPDAPLERLGVGMIDPSPRADSITTRADDGDFKRQVARNFAINPGGNPLLFVVKKNASVLRNLLSWVRFAADAKDEQGRPYVKDVPLLVIDDEADQGSIDTKAGALDEDGVADPEHDPSTLNKLVRNLLHLFDQNAYIGYTATPFANIFIHEQGKTVDEGEDLFPRSFIVSLPTPSNYVGPGKVFGYEDEEGEEVPGLPIIHTVDDQAATQEPRETEGWMPPRHNKRHVPLYEGNDDIPPSLRQAIHAFLLVCAARLARGQTARHNSMLVHVTRFTAVQDKVAEQIRSEILDIRRRLRLGDGSSPYQLVDELRALWLDDFLPTTSEINHVLEDEQFPLTLWEEIEPLLARAAGSIEVRAINGQAGEVLDYITHEATGLNVIAVGGDKLSRGLTLEGLSVSYFLRASRMYDTLMQMGRWFGYRPGYLDLCRLYTTAEMTEWFAYIAQASEELRDDFNRMVASGGTPLDFGHRVKSHPLLMVTSQVKMRYGTKVDVTFEGDISETINFWRTRQRLEPNWNAAVGLVADIEARGARPQRVRNDDLPQAAPRSWKWSGVHAESVLAFLAEYQQHPASKKVITSLLGEYIRLENDHGRLTTWTVAVISGSSQSEEVLGDSRFRLVERSWHLTDTRTPRERQALQEQNHYRIRRLVSPVDECIDLDDTQYREAMARTLEEWRDDQRGRNEPSRPAGLQIRSVRDARNGLLLLYPLDGRDARQDLTGSDKVEVDARGFPVLGFAISFPLVTDGTASKVQYVVNSVYVRQEFGGPDDDDEVPT